MSRAAVAAVDSGFREGIRLCLAYRWGHRLGVLQLGHLPALPVGTAPHDGAGCLLAQPGRFCRDRDVLEPPPHEASEGRRPGAGRVGDLVLGDDVPHLLHADLAGAPPAHDEAPGLPALSHGGFLVEYILEHSPAPLPRRARHRRELGALEAPEFKGLYQDREPLLEGPGRLRLPGGDPARGGPHRSDLLPTGHQDGQGVMATANTVPPCDQAE
mmetsp:Transcript_50111/g.99014  ORF Transcript_50111/g.99014 Transcript_50111/m.99014 type:complete len:214 (-) Transcript_50111:176-817(-)